MWMLPDPLHKFLKPLRFTPQRKRSTSPIPVPSDTPRSAVLSFVGCKHFRPVGIGQNEVERNKREDRRAKRQVASSPPLAYCIEGRCQDTVRPWPTHLAEVPASCSHRRGPPRWLCPPSTLCDAARSGSRTARRPCHTPASGVSCSDADRRTAAPRGSRGTPAPYRSTSPGTGLWQQDSDEYVSQGPAFCP
jgi:hypothetical protein